MILDSLANRISFCDSYNENVYSRYADAWRLDRIPSRADIDLFALPRGLPNLYIVDVVDLVDGDAARGFKVRLMGTNLVERLKHECTGQLVSDLRLGGWEREWSSALLGVLETRRPVVAVDSLTLPSGLRLAVEHLALPLSRDGTAIDQVVGAVAFLGHHAHRQVAADPAMRLVNLERGPIQRA